MVPDATHFAKVVVDWVWLHRSEPFLLVPGFGPGGRDIVSPDRPIMTVLVDFSAGADLRRIPLQDIHVLWRL